MPKPLNLETRRAGVIKYNAINEDQTKNLEKKKP